MNSRISIGISLIIVAVTGCAKSHPDPSSETKPVVAAAPPAPKERKTTPASVEINPRLLRRFAPVAKKGDELPPPSAEQVELGRMLYHENRLSVAHDISCNSCHMLDKYGVDGKPTSPGHKGQLGTRNSPSVYNSAHNFQQFWDGRAPNVEEQATGPILNPVEMASNEERVLKTLKSIPEYVSRFKQAFPKDAEAVTMANVGRAIGAFERKLDTKSRWDAYIAGDKNALTNAEKEGLQVFLNSGCMVCHTGPQVGAAMFQKVGSVEPWPNQKDQGRYEVTKAPGDKMLFKVPSLRNVAKTAPYFHDGSAATLEEAIRMMGRHQLGLDLSDKEIASIVTWMNSLTGELPADLMAKPELPASTATTPKPG
jgi:cytochrome c peroxidase